jgi:hypothetical protein
MDTITTEELRAWRDKRADLTLVSGPTAETSERTQVPREINIPSHGSLCAEQEPAAKVP